MNMILMKKNLKMVLWGNFIIILSSDEKSSILALCLEIVKLMVNKGANIHAKNWSRVLFYKIVMETLGFY